MTLQPLLQNSQYADIDLALSLNIDVFHRKIEHVQVYLIDLKLLYTNDLHAMK